MVSQSLERYYLIDPKDICYFTFTLEAYEGLAVVTTLDPKTAVIKLQIAPGWEYEVDAIINHEADLNMKAVNYNRRNPSLDEAGL